MGRMTFGDVIVQQNESVKMLFGKRWGLVVFCYMWRDFNKVSGKNGRGKKAEGKMANLKKADGKKAEGKNNQWKKGRRKKMTEA